MSKTWGRGKEIRPVRVEGDVAYVPLTRGYQAMIDAADAPLVADRNWAYHPQGGRWHVMGYAHSSWPLPRMLMHRIILGVGPGRRGIRPGDIVVDHRNGNGLDNRRSNLRTLTALENNQHRWWLVEVDIKDVA